MSIRHYHGIERVHLAACDLLQRDYDLRGDRDRLDGQMRSGGMTSFADDANPDAVRRRPAYASCNRQPTGWIERRYMKRRCRVDARLLQDAVVNHRLRAGQPFLRRLEHELDIASWQASLRQHLRRRHQHARVRIMTAQMSLPFEL
ncbi:MAG: hypothetical protein K0Q59_3249 [Paenibacillus sp.]|nr:hypothetical protein [Paenibacillus sp.]